MLYFLYLIPMVLCSGLPKMITFGALIYNIYVEKRLDFFYLFSKFSCMDTKLCKVLISWIKKHALYDLAIYEEYYKNRACHAGLYSAKKLIEAIKRQ